MALFVVHQNPAFCCFKNLFLCIYSNRFFSIFTELQRKRCWQGCIVYNDDGYRQEYVPTLCSCEEDPEKLTGEVRRTGCLHEHRVSRRDQGQDEERPDLGSAVVR